MSFFACFQPEVYYTLLATLLIISLTISAINRKILYFFGHFWNYISVLLSHSHSFRATRLSEALVSGVWLMSCTVLLAAFSGLLREQLLRPDPIYWIDSLLDLYQRNELVIQTHGGGYFETYTRTNHLTDSMANNFNDRFEISDWSNIFDEIDYPGICEGRTAVVSVLEWLHIMKDKLNCEEDIDYHISLVEEVSTPMFLATNKGGCVVSQTLQFTNRFSSQTKELTISVTNCFSSQTA